jgi:hypothetical protein
VPGYIYNHKTWGNETGKNVKNAKQANMKVKKRKTEENIGVAGRA